MNKLTTLEQAVSLIGDGACVGLGGNTLNRAPMAAVFEMVRQKKRGLRVVKTAGAMDVDALCLAGCAASVDAGFISYESQYGLAQLPQKRAVRAGARQRARLLHRDFGPARGQLRHPLHAGARP